MRDQNHDKIVICSGRDQSGGVDGRLPDAGDPGGIPGHPHPGHRRRGRRGHRGGQGLQRRPIHLGH